MSFSDKVVVVTGAGSGIGEAIAISFAGAGAKVVFVDINDIKQTTIKKCSINDSRPLIIKADLTKEDELKQIVPKTIEKYGKIDILVNNAGIIKKGTLFEGTVFETYDEVMNTNLRAAVYLTSLFAPHLSKTKGNIVNISSVASVRLFAHVAYCISKAGVNHFTSCAALELAKFGIRVNAVLPGYVQTDIINNMNFRPEEVSSKWEHIERSLPLKKLAEPEEIANLVFFLASDKAKSITGSLFTCDSGFALK